MVTLEGEREDAKWILLGVTVKVQAREGESITAPATDFRQERSAGGFGNYVIMKLLLGGCSLRTHGSDTVLLCYIRDETRNVVLQ